MAGSANVRVWPSAAPTRAVALVLHGGAERGLRTVRPWGLAYLRMLPFVRALHGAGAASGLEVRLLRNRVRGWNEPDMDPVSDARSALERIHRAHPDAVVVVVGHSMGGRVALHVADDAAVAGVCALAPWTPRGEPVDAVLGRAVLIAHGVHDRMTDPAHSLAYADRAHEKAARLARFEIADDGHPMLRRARVWTDLVRAFVLETTGLAPPEEPLTSAWDKPPSGRLRIEL